MIIDAHNIKQNFQLWRKLKFTPQFDQMDCGPACVRMVASYWGKLCPLPLLRQWAGMSREGVSVAGIHDALNHLGMDCMVYKMTTTVLAQKCPLPAILYWDQNHFVVLNGVKKKFLGANKHAQYIFRIANPACGQSWMKQEEMERHWLTKDEGIVVVTAPSEDTKSEFHVHDDKHSMLHFARQYVRPFRKSMLALGLCMMLGIFFNLLTPFVTQALVDKGISQKDLGLIGMLLLAQVCIFGGNFIQNFISNWVSLYVGTHINIHLLSDYLKKLLRLPMQFFDTKSTGDYNQRINDHSRLQNFVTQGALQTFFSLITIPVLIGVIGYYSPKILLVYAIFTLCSLLWTTYFLQRRKVMDYEQFRLNAKNQNKLFEMMNGITEIKLSSYEEGKTQQWEEVQQQLYKMNKRVLRLDQCQNAGFSLISQLRNVLITFWIAAEVVRGNLTLGMMMSISAMMGQLDGPLSSLISFVRQFQDARISLERSEEVRLSEEEDQGRKKEIQPGASYSYSLQNVSFAYPGSGGRKALDGINIDIPANKMTAIVGESGSGKTTLMKLLLSFYSPQSGCIMLNGADLQLYTAKSVRQHAGIVMQDGFIFSDTIANNICLSNPYDDNHMQQSLRIACLSEWVNALPLKLNTKVGAEGNGISGGERQRLMIARAVYKKASCLFFDEATSSLDADNERAITENIDHFFATTTRIVIAHRLSTVCQADLIIVMHHGRIVETGTHSELVHAKGYYYELIKNQLEIGQ